MIEAPGFVSIVEAPAGLLAGNSLKPEAVSCDSDYDSEYDGTGGTDSDDTADNENADPESEDPEPVD